MAEPDTTTVPTVGLVDLHCHILPGWDDGAPDLEEALEMARQWVEGGVTTIAATPHIGHPTVYARREAGEPHPRHIPAAVQELQARLDEAAVPLRLLSGGELTFGEPDLSERAPSRPWLTYGGLGKHLLLESTFHSWPRFANPMLYHLNLAGITPVIAHPERLPDVQKDPRLLTTAVRGGAILQITARALVDEEDKRMARCARELVELGLAGIVASDAHRAAGAVLPPQTLEVVTRLTDAEEAQRLIVDNPRRIAEGHDTLASLPRDPKPAARPKLFDFFRKGTSS